jgi:dTMP kinase
MKGLFVVFEGIDGTGKTTQVRRLAAALRALGREAVELREPTGGSHGAEIRRMAIEGRPDPDRERELFVMDRREDVERNILPALERGAVVVLDRYYFSTMAYQGARGIDPGEIRAENEEFAPKPDLLVLLDLSVAEALKRVRESRGAAPDEFEQADSLARVKAIFDALDDPFILRMDASGTENEIAQAILARVEELLAGRQEPRKTLRQ